MFSNMKVEDIDITKLSDNPEELKTIILNLKNEHIKKVGELNFDILKLNETIKIYQFKLCGRKSENLPKEEEPGLFNESETKEYGISGKSPAEKIKVSYERLKKCGKRPLPADLPRVEKVIDLKPEDKICSCCGKELVKIDDE